MQQGPPQHQNMQGNNPMAIPAMLNQIQLLLQQREQLQQQMMQQSIQNLHQKDHQQQSQMGIYSGCATPEYLDFDDAPMQALSLATLQDKLESVCSECETQESDGFQESPESQNSMSNSFDGFETTPYEARWEPSGSDSYGSSTPDFPPIYGEGQPPVKMMPPMQRVPLLLAPAPQMNMIGNETGDAIEHYAGDMEIKQAPLPEESLFTQTPDTSINGTWESNSGYQVKNTFISTKSTTNKPLRCVRSAAGRLTEMQNQM
jgi:hypothetical protein